MGTGSNGRNGLLVGDAREDGGDGGGAGDGGVNAHAGDGSSGRGRGRSGAGGLGEGLASFSSGGLGLDEVGNFTGLGEARSDDGEELRLEAGVTLAGGVVELAAGLGDVLLETLELRIVSCWVVEVEDGVVVDLQRTQADH